MHFISSELGFLNPFGSVYKVYKGDNMGFTTSIYLPIEYGQKIKDNNINVSKLTKKAIDALLIEQASDENISAEVLQPFLKAASMKKLRREPLNADFFRIWCNAIRHEYDISVSPDYLKKLLGEDSG